MLWAFENEQSKVKGGLLSPSNEKSSVKICSSIIKGERGRSFPKVVLGASKPKIGNPYAPYPNIRGYVNAYNHLH